ncbi:MAG: alpha/beta hydrolase-fold protein [Planctomycetota bacterium]
MNFRSIASYYFSRALPVLATFGLALVSVTVMAQEDSYPVPEEAIKQEGVPEGKLLGPFDFYSKIYPGTERQYWLYIPAQYEAEKAACCLIVQDGIGRARGWKLPQIMDNLIHQERMPITIGVFVDHGKVPTTGAGAQPRFNRSFEYDSLGDRYARFLIEELLPEISKEYSISQDPNDRALAGASSGGICAFNAAWERPDAFRRVLCTIGTFVGLRGGNQLSALVRKHEAKPLRIFMQDGSSDLNIYAGDWWTANQDMYSSLKWAGYDVKNVWGEGGHNGKHSASIMPEALEWLWRDYPDAIQAAPNKTSKRRIELLIEGEDWEEVSTGHESVESLATNAGGQVFFSDAKAGRVFRIGEDGKARVFVEQSTDIRQMSFCPDGQLLAIQNGNIVRFGTDGKMHSFREGANANSLVTIPTGVFFADNSKNDIHFCNFEGDSLSTTLSPEMIVSLVPTADQQFLHLIGMGQFTHHSRIKEQSLDSTQEYGFLELPYAKPQTGASGSMLDERGRMYVASDVGVQVLDQLGRVNFILASPSGESSTGITFGGASLDYLYVATSKSVYRRKIATKGKLSFTPAVTLQKPGL